MIDPQREFARQHLEAHGIYNDVEVDDAVHQLLESYIPSQTQRGQSAQTLWDLWSRQEHQPVAADLPPLIMSTIWEEIARSAKAQVQRYGRKVDSHLVIDTGFVSAILTQIDLANSTKRLDRLRIVVDKRETEEQNENSRQEAENNATRIIESFNSNWRVVLDYEVSRNPPNQQTSTWVGAYLNTYLFPVVDLSEAITVNSALISAVVTLNTWSTSNDTERNQVAAWLVAYVRGNVLKDDDQVDPLLVELINLALSSHMTLAPVVVSDTVLANVTFSFRPKGTVDDEFEQELSNLVKILL